MIYITQRYSDFSERNEIKSLWEVKYDDVWSRYSDFIHNEAKKRNIVINKYYFMMADNKIHNNHLTETDYKITEKEWERFRKRWNIDKFISDKLKGRKLKYTIL